MELANRQLLVLEFVVALFAWASIARVFWRPRLDAMEPRLALRATIAPQMFRIVGLTLLANNVPAPGLDPDFARWVATGDAVTSALAIVTFIALGRPGKLGFVLASATTIIGALDLIRNVTIGAAINAAEFLGAGWFVVAFVVPLMFVAHVGAARILVRRATWR